jgi:HIT domain
MPCVTPSRDAPAHAGDPQAARLGLLRARPLGAQRCHRLLEQQKLAIEGQDASVEGFNVGVNEGETAGQTVFHCHLHLVPRRRGDVQDPMGGVRSVIPGKGVYP